MALSLFAVAQHASAQSTDYARGTVHKDGTGAPLFWDDPSLVLRPAADTAEDVTAQLARLAIIRSAATWNEGGDACSSVALAIGDPPPELGTNLIDAPRDNENRIVWRQDEWPGDDSSALAITTEVFNTITGELLDADIDLNGYDFVWTATDNPEEILADIQNTVTHELGHVIGFGHNSDTGSTMFAASVPGETSKRHLNNTDIRGLCEVYPQDASLRPPLTLRATPACSVAPAIGSPARPASGMVLAMVWLFALRRAQLRMTNRTARRQTTRDRDRRSPLRHRSGE